MQATRRLLHRQPMIRFLGKRTTPPKIDHAPHTHPAAPSDLPKSFTNSFAAYRQSAQQHGPLNTSAQSSGSNIGHMSGHQLGPVEPRKGIFFDRSEMGSKWRRVPWTQAEIEAIESGGASMWA